MTAGRIYEVEDSIATVTSAAILLALTLPADICVEVLEASITIEDVDTSEQFSAALDRATGTAAGGAAVVALPLNTGDVATSVTELSASGAAITGLTAQNELFGSRAQPSVVGWHYKPAGDEARVFSPSQVIILRTLSTIASSTVRVYMKFKEIGG